MGRMDTNRDAEFLLAHDSFVRALARSLLRDEHRADEIVQQTWLVALEHSPRCAALLRPWLLSICRHLSVKALLGERRREARERKWAPPEALPSTDEILAREAARRSVVEAVVSLDEP